MTRKARNSAYKLLRALCDDDLFLRHHRFERVACLHQYANVVDITWAKPDLLVFDTDEQFRMDDCVRRITEIAGPETRMYYVHLHDNIAREIVVDEPFDTAKFASSARYFADWLAREDGICLLGCADSLGEWAFHLRFEPGDSFMLECGGPQGLFERLQLGAI